MQKLAAEMEPDDWAPVTERGREQRVTRLKFMWTRVCVRATVVVYEGPSKLVPGARRSLPFPRPLEHSDKPSSLHATDRSHSVATRSGADPTGTLGNNSSESLATGRDAEGF